MVKKAPKESVPSFHLDHNEEEFVEASGYLANDALNDDEANDNDAHLDEKDDLLIEKLKSLSGYKSKRLRTEVVSGELDVNINSTKNDSNAVHKIKTHELLSTLKNVSDAGNLRKLFAKAHKRTKVLETPLPKHISEKAQRLTTYIQDKKEISQWDPVIKKNRQADQLVFPLKQPDYSMQTASSFCKTWKPENDLEKEISELLQSSENNLTNQKLLTEAELKAIQSMNLEDIKQKRSEFLKLKALQQYQESKFKRVKHIKSKRYRKILRREKEKEEAKGLAKMETDDPIQFKEVLADLEKKRMKERMSLKHKNTSKWARQQAIYAKYSDRARDQVQEQLEINKKLTQKVVRVDEDDDDEEEAPAAVNLLASTNLSGANLGSSDNPWLKMMFGVGGNASKDKTTTEKINGGEASYSKPVAFVDQTEREKAQQELDDIDDESDSEYGDVSNERNVEDVSHVFKDDEEDAEAEEVTIITPPAAKKAKKAKKIKIVKSVSGGEEAASIDKPKEVVATTRKETNLKPSSEIISSFVFDTEAINKANALNDGPKKIKLPDHGDKHRLTLQEAFADDDVMEEFKADKKATEESEKVKSIDLSLPGWGGWAGAGIDPSLIKVKRKKYRNRNGKFFQRPLVINPQDTARTDEERAQLVRRDKDLAHVIISEKKDTRIAEFQVNELPHKFTNIHDFEAKIMQPIGRTWNPDHKFRKLTLPKVKTRIGSIIEPIDKDALVKHKKPMHYKTKKNK